MIELLHNFHFLRPYAFFALLPLGYFIFKNYRQHSDSASHWQKICDRELLAYLLDKSDSQSTRIQFWLTSFMAFLAIIALAAPAWQKLPTPAFRNNSALVIALNLSYSMNAEDIKPSRLIRARYKIDDLLEQRKDGQTALLVYSNKAFTVTPLTNDIQTIRSQLEALTTDIMPAQGNNTLAGLEKAASLLKQAGLPQGHILLIADDVSSSNNSEITNALGSYQLSILGVGTAEGSPVSLPEGGFLKDESGQIIVPKLNSAELLKVAVANHGYFQAMTADDTDIQKLLNRFDESLNRPADKTNLFLEQWDDAGYWLIFLIVPWAAFQFRKGMLCLAILIVLPFPKNSYAFEWQNLWRTPDQQAQRAYNKQHYEQAAEKFENPDWKAAAQYQSGDFENATANFQQTGNFYNQGNALAKKGQFTEALAAYEQALKENPYDNDAKHNKELVEKELEKQQNKNNKQDKPSDSKDNSTQDSQKSKESNDDSKSPDSQSEQKKEHQAGNNPEKKEDTKKEESKNNEKNNESKNSNEKQTEQQNKNQATESESLTTEQQQANEQWLKRIPDDPATLLKRKFKYQYNQQY